MTSKQRQWLIENGYDPIEYDIDQQGNVVEREIAPQQEVMSKPRAFGTSFAGSVLPTAGGLAASAPFIGLSIANPLIGIPALIASGMAGGYGTGKLQEAALERFAPEAIAEMQRAQTDQPVMSYLGGFAPSALAFRPSLGGVKGLTAPLMSGSQAAKRAAFIPAAVNVGANVGSAGAGQLLNISEGGEFSAPRFAADVALGSLLSKPTFIGRKMGFPDLAPEVQPIERLDLAGERGAIAGREAEAARAAALAEDEAASARATELLGANAPRQAEMFGPDARRFELAENQRVVSEAFDKLGLEKNPEIIQDYVNDPMLSNFRDDPAAVLDYVSEKTGLKARSEAETAAGEARRASEAFEAEYAGKPTEFENVPLKQQIVTDGRRTEIAENRQAIDNALKRLKTSVPEEVVQDLANDPMLGNVRDNPEELTKFIAEKADKYLENSWQRSMEDINQLGRKLEQGLAQEEVGFIDREQERAWAAKEQGITDIASELQARFQREGGEGRITQADIDAAAEIAAKRGLKMQFTTPEQQAQGIRGAYMINEAGERVIYIDANAATRDTAIHEIGHDVFVRSANERMKRSLMQTAEGSEAYKREYAARLAEVDKNGQRVNTDEQARNLALEEGVIQAFGEAYPNVPRGEIRAWFNALKASLKSMVGMKISPEDAARWLHYATTEIVPWKGVAVAKGGEERMQRAQQETPEFKNWFGESKVVDAEGKPLVMYHGTGTNDITIFNSNRAQGEIAGFFAFNPKFASDFAGGYDAVENTSFPSVYPVYLRAEKIFDVRNPLEASKIKSLQEPRNYKTGWDWTNFERSSFIQELKANGYDGYLDFEFGSNKYPTGIAVFDPAQIKSATANKGTFDPSNPDIRYQRGPVGKAADAVKGRIDKTLGEIDQITRRGGIYETVGRSLTRMYNTAQSMFGRSQAIAPEIYKLGDADAIKLTKHLLQEHRTRTRITPAPEITAAYNEWRNIVKRFWVDENNAVGNTIRQGTGMRERLIDEFWLPFHKESDDVRKILSERVGTPEYQKLKDDYVREATDSYLQQGMNQQAARNKAIADFETERSVILAPFDPSAPATFAGARKPQGRPLPESWGELNFRDLLESYNRRSAKDYASQMALERSPEVMTALGSKKMHNDQPIPAAILQNTPIISTDPSVQSVLREFSGRPLQTPGKFVRGIGSIASALALQTVSRIGDIGGTVTKPLAYVGLGDYATYMSGMSDKLSNWSQLQLRSIESGLNNPNAHQNFRQAISVGDDAGKYMKRFVNSIGSLTLSNKLESIARTLAQAQGEMIVSINKRKAMTGDKDAVRFLDTLNADWRTTNDTDLAGQFGLLMQGSYDMRQLPAWFLESGAAPYLTWSKWSMSQMNNFRKFAVEPAMQGDFKPLIAQLLVGMAGGGAIEEIQEWLNNKESKAINWSELQSWAEQNEGELGSDGGQLLTQKLLMMAQKTGTFGFAGDLMLLPVNALVGDTQGVIGAYPALELTTDLAKNIGGALGAIDKGEDVGLVLKRFGKNMIVGKTQVLRVISNWADELENEGAENLRSADRRKQRLFDELNGMSRAGMFPVSYENLAEQEFERGVIDEDTGEEAFELVSRAREEATSREDYASRIRKYKTSQNQIMPSLERQPMKAARYLSFVEGAEEGAGAETMRRYLTREYENKYRKSLVEGLSGLR
jgi:hypothetical protein